MLAQMWRGMQRVLGFGPTPAQRKIAALQEQLISRSLEAQVAMWDNWVDPREPLYDAADFWAPTGEVLPWGYDNRKRGEVVPVYLTEYGLKVLRDQSRRLLATNEFAINAVENRANYTVGKGYQYAVVPRRQQGEGSEAVEHLVPIQHLAQRILDEFIARTTFNEREQEIVRRCDRDGEAILRFFRVGGGRLEVRFVEPELLRDFTGRRECAFGVVSLPWDTESITHYSIVEDPDKPTPTYVPADEIVHLKLNVDGSAKRGLPTLFPVRKNLERAEKLLRNMSVLAQIQSTFALFRKHKQFSAGAVSAFRQAQADVQGQNPFTGQDTWLKHLPPGAIVDTTENTEYEFPASRVDASSLVSILQAELRAVAARLCIPEYMLTTDASNANFASTLVAEAPAVKNFERLQAYFGRRFGDGGYAVGSGAGVLWRVLAEAVDYGLLPEDVLTEFDIQAEAPSAVSRDKAKESGRGKLLNDAGVLSLSTWSKWEGLDHEQEQEQIRREGRSSKGPKEADPPESETPTAAPPGSAGGESVEV